MQHVCLWHASSQTLMISIALSVCIRKEQGRRLCGAEDCMMVAIAVHNYCVLHMASNGRNPKYHCTVHKLRANDRGHGGWLAMMHPCESATVPPHFLWIKVQILLFIA
jgi:hypothetical protein